MKTLNMICLLALLCAAQPATAVQAAGTGPYALTKLAKVGGDGNYDYVTADAAGRGLYIPRGNRVEVYDLDTLGHVGTIPDTPNAHGVAVDPVAGRAFSSSSPVVFWNTHTLEILGRIEVEGSPDAIAFDPATNCILVLSHEKPNLTLLDSLNGTIVGTIADLGGAPEQAAADGKGRVFIAIEDRDEVAVVDTTKQAVVGRYGLGGRGGTPAGLALDAAHGVLFVGCRKPQVAVMLSADDGRILGTVPIGAGVDSASFNPATGEAFTSQRDGTLSVIREVSPTRFELEQTVATRPGARTSTLDTRTGRILLITAERAPATAERTRPGLVPGSFSILVVSRVQRRP
jgi:DNA-binding beta-propeller fold protein YncE